MNKSELVTMISAKAELTKKDAEKFLDAFESSIIETLQHGEKIQLVGFGTFEVSDRAERVCRNPQTGVNMTIPATKVPKFKPGKVFKDMIAKAKK